MNLPPLDSAVTWTRGQSADTPPGHTRELLSPISEVTAKQAFSWQAAHRQNGAGHASAAAVPKMVSRMILRSPPDGKAPVRVPDKALSPEF